MRISILTLFPEMFTGPFDISIIARAQQKQAVDINIINLRSFCTDTYKTVDDHPYGGGVGMVLKVDVVDKALSSIPKGKIILLDPQGSPYVQKKARELATDDHLIFLCAHYEGVDERIRSLVDEQISIGDYVLTGGELPAMVLIDSIVRLLPGVLKEEATSDESFSSQQLEYPQYTRPEIYKGKRVPKILLSGNHAKILEWRKKQRVKRTKLHRPDLITAQKG